MPGLDVIAIGRASVDLYGQQIGGRLEDMGTFARSIGGSPANIAIGAARLGLKSGHITRVGNEHMGRFILEQYEREGVSTGAAERWLAGQIDDTAAVDDMATRFGNLVRARESATSVTAA